MSKTKAELEAERRSAEAEYLALCQKGRIESLKAAANITDQDPLDVPSIFDGNREGALYTAAKGNHLDIVIELLKLKCDPNAANFYGYTPLYWASMSTVQSVRFSFPCLFAFSYFSTTYYYAYRTSLCVYKIYPHSCPLD